MIKAMKEKRTEDKEVLSFLLSKIKNKAIDLRVEDLPDIDTIQVIQKFVKGLEEEKESLQRAGRSLQAKTISNQINVVNKYLPSQMGEKEIKAIIENLPDKTIPFVMKHFKENYSGRVDMKLVNKIVREL